MNAAMTKSVSNQPLSNSVKRKPTATQIIGSTVRYTVLIVLSIFLLIPFVWLVLSSLKTNNEIGSLPITIFPEEWMWHHYVELWQKTDMLTWLGNTMFIATLVTFLHVLTGSFAAYGFSRIRFPGRDTLFIIYIGTIAVPWQAYMIPQFKMISWMGLTNTRWSIVLLQTFSAFGVFLMKQFYDTIPEELSEAARIDGLSEFGIYWRIMIPLSVPPIASLTIISFTQAWNDYMGPLIYLRDRSLWTIQLGLQTFSTEENTDYSAIFTASVMSVLPIAIVFALGQRYFIEGIATSGLKG